MRFTTLTVRSLLAAALATAAFADDPIIPIVDPTPNRNYTPPAGLTRANPANRKLVVIVHGWNDNATVRNPDTAADQIYNLLEEGWVHRMAQKIRAYNPDGWDVWEYNWKNDAARGFVTTAEAALKSFKTCIPKARAHGFMLAKAIKLAGGDNPYEHIHFISHSLGGMVIDTATVNVKDVNPGCKVHETFLDCPAPYGPDYKDWVWDTLFGKKADCAEHYFNDDGVGKTIPFLGKPFKFAYSVNVTDMNPYPIPPERTMNPDNGLTVALAANQRHRYLREYYEETITGNAGHAAGANNMPPAALPVPMVDYDLLGYGLSREVAEATSPSPLPPNLWPPNKKRVGELDIVSWDSTNAKYRFFGEVPPPAVEMPRTPQVDEVPGRRRGVNPAPDWLPITPEIVFQMSAGADSSQLLVTVDTNMADGPVNYMAFDYKFDGDRSFGQSGLSIHRPNDAGDDWDMIDDFLQQFAVNDGAFHQAIVAFDPISPGDHGKQAFAFRMDSPSGGLTSTVTITNLHFGHSETPYTGYVYCAADFNQDGGIDGADVGAFFNAWEQSDVYADINQDGGVDGTDVAAFFELWEAGGCT